MQTAPALPSRLLIAPSILAANFARLGDEVRAAQDAGADLIHIDVMDGRFVPNLSFGLPIVEAVRRVTSLPLDVHLMIVEPERWIERFATAGASRITVHIEACAHLHAALTSIRAVGCGAGVALNPHTPAALLGEVMGVIDNVIVMTVNPGFGGQPFLRETLPKIAALRGMIDSGGRAIDLTVDGGITPETATLTRQAGANVFVAGSAVFNKGFSAAEGVARLRASLSA